MDKAFDAFFRRLKDGENPGYPRFKGRGRYDSLTYSQWENGVKLAANEKRLILSKVGDVKLIYHRPLEGTPKTATIRRTATGKWFVSISCEWEPTPLPPTGQEVGIDVGLKTFATGSDTTTIANPRFFREEEQALAKAQRAEVTAQIRQSHPEMDEQQVRQLVNQDKDEQSTWKERQRRRKMVARVHERITWRRDDFTHQHSRRIVNYYDLIAVEDLTIRNMTQLHALAKSIHDVAWGQFADLLAIKAAWAGRHYVAVNPAYTSQDCSRCGHRNPDLTLADRVYHCLNPVCLLILDRDRNAALNMLALGRQCLGLAPRSPPL
jgi:putative transposase